MEEFTVNVPSNVVNTDVSRLDSAERSFAVMMGLTEAQYLRSKADLIAKEETKRKRGRELGLLVGKVLGGLEPGYQLRSVNWNGGSLSWTLEIEKDGSHQHVVLPWTLVDDVLDSKTNQEFQRLRNLVLFGIGRQDLIGARG